MTRTYGGLGLAVVRALVELHRGSVSAEGPGDGAGATFTVCLPLLPVGQPRDALTETSRG
jgi:signal transduction histidine kinase